MEEFVDVVMMHSHRLDLLTNAIIFATAVSCGCACVSFISLAVMFRTMNNRHINLENDNER